MLQYVLPTSSENNILIYSNGKWITSAIDYVINSNATINEHIKSITKNTSYTKNEVYTKGDVYNKSEVDNKISSNTFNMLINSCVAINNLVNSRCNPFTITIDKYIILR